MPPRRDGSVPLGGEARTDDLREALLDAFELASDIRLLDMQAAPYDLSAWGIAPVRIETADGKAEYVRRQREFADRGSALRGRMLECWLGSA